MTETDNLLVIWGASGHAKVLSEFTRVAGFRIVAIFDNDPAVAKSPVHGASLHIGRAGFDEWIEHWDNWPVYGAAAIGGTDGAGRLEVLNYMSERGVRIASLVHPRAYVAESARLGAGSQVLVNASICAEAELGRACIVNTAASVDHECSLADGVHVGPGARLAGCIQVGRCAFIGTGASILPRLRIGCNAIVGAGAVVTKNVPDGAVVFGNPARITRIREVSNGIG